MNKSSNQDIAKAAQNESSSGTNRHDFKLVGLLKIIVAKIGRSNQAKDFDYDEWRRIEFRNEQEPERTPPPQIFRNY